MSNPARLELAARGALADIASDDLLRLMDREPDDGSVAVPVRELLADVRRRGDEAIFSASRKFDGVELEDIEVPRARWRAALDSLESDLVKALERSAENILTAHRAMMPSAVEVTTEPGVVVGRRPDPLSSAGVYAPGGRAAYPSSLLMGAMAARAAGVGEVVVTSPPNRTGYPATVVMASAELCQVDGLFTTGGATAIGALAYGTETVPSVDVVVGPGNAYVREAKRQVAGSVRTDSPAGPSELVIVADGSALPDAVALELLAQAEHDPNAAAVALLLPSIDYQAVLAALADRLSMAERQETMTAALAARGAVLQVTDLTEAVRFVNQYCAEHVQLAIANSREVFREIRNAGTVCLGPQSSVVFGDFLTGANHVLPTGRSGRVWSGLGPETFIRWASWQTVTPEAGARLADDCARLALAEGLPGHARAAELRRRVEVAR